MQYCNFGTALEDMIRDRFVRGINSLGSAVNYGVIQRRLLAMKNFKLADTLATTLLIEAADRNAQELQSSQDATVHAVARGEEDRRTSQQSCYCCGGNHSLHNCQFKEAFMQEVRHIARAC